MAVIEMPEEFYIDRWDQANIPIKMRGQDFRHYEPSHRTGAAALESAKVFVDRFSDHYVSKKRAQLGNFPDNRENIGKGMLLYGRNGTRKSTLAAAIATEVQYLSPAYYTYYIRFSDWKRALTDTFTKDETERTVIAKKILRMVELAHLLILDDIGQEHRTTSGFTESALHELLRIRYEKAYPTIVTTNIDPESMRGVYGDSFASFLYDAFDLFPILGSDTRLTKD